LAAAVTRKPCGSTIDHRTSTSPSAASAPRALPAIRRPPTVSGAIAGSARITRLRPSRAIATTASSAPSPTRASVAASVHGRSGAARPTTTTRSITGAAAAGPAMASSARTTIERIPPVCATAPAAATQE